MLLMCFLFFLAFTPPKRIALQSTSLQKKMHYSLLLPTAYQQQKSYPMLVLLHGLGGTDTGWRRGRLYKQLQQAMESEQLPKLILVMPDGERGYWSNWVDGKHRYGDWVFEVINHIKKEHRISVQARDSMLVGISMGAFGALSLGLRNPEKFGIIVALSPTDMEIAVKNRPRYSVYVDLLGYPANQKHLRAINPVELLRKGAGKGQLIALIYGDAEQEKFSLGAQRLLQVARKKQIPIQTRVVKGGVHSFQSTWTPESMAWWINLVGKWLKEDAVAD